MRFRISILGCAVLGFLSYVEMAWPVRAADFKLIPESETSGPPDGCDLWLTGKINPGDADVLEGLLGNRQGGKGNPIIACLNSPGGNFKEGLALAKLFVARSVATRILANHECKSACAIAFMAGMSYSTGGAELSRSMHVSSRLGFHAPEPDLVPGTYDIDDLQNAYASAIASVGNELLALAGHRARNWYFQLIKSELINEMMIVHGAQNFFYIDTVRRATEYQIQIEGAVNYKAFEIDDARNACENAIANGTSSYLADWFFKNSIQKISRKQNRGVQAYIVDVRRNKDIYCEVTKESNRSVDDNNISVLYNTSGGERLIVGLPSWVALPGDTPLVQLAENTFKGAQKEKPAWCNSARAESEIAICNSRELLKADGLIERLYHEALASAKDPDRTQLSGRQKAWIVARNGCKKDYVCLNEKYREQIDSFEDPQ